MSTNTMQLDPEFRVETSRARSAEATAWLNWAKNRFEALRRRRQRRQAIAELSRMSDWRLADMGIPRDQIAEVVDGLIERDGPAAGRTAR
jgi:uncharacterized protein YjiS (DUF1127 family)